MPDVENTVIKPCIWGLELQVKQERAGLVCSSSVLKVPLIPNRAKHKKTNTVMAVESVFQHHSLTKEVGTE